MVGPGFPRTNGGRKKQKIICLNKYLRNVLFFYILANKFPFPEYPEVGEKQWAEERKKKVSENNGQLSFHGSRLDQKMFCKMPITE